MEFPITVKSIVMKECSHYRTTSLFGGEKVGARVVVRPCSDNPEDKSYEGVLLGEFAVGIHTDHDAESGQLNVAFGMTNPGIWIPELKRVVFGYESWWGIVENPDEPVQPITDETIENIPYVKAFRDLAEADKERVVDEIRKGW